MATPYVRALKKAIEQHEHELANMKAALAHHEHADADMEIMRQTSQQPHQQRRAESRQRRSPVEKVGQA